LAEYKTAFIYVNKSVPLNTKQPWCM